MTRIQLLRAVNAPDNNKNLTLSHEDFDSLLLTNGQRILAQNTQRALAKMDPNWAGENVKILDALRVELSNKFGFGGPVANPFEVLMCFCASPGHILATAIGRK